MKSRIKSVWNIFLAFCMALTIIPLYSLPAQAAEADDLRLSFTLDKENVKPGNEVTVTVSLENYNGNETINGIRGLEIGMPFDPELVEYVENSAKVLLETTQFYLPPSVTFDSTRNEITFLYAAKASQSLERTSAELFSFTVKVKEELTTDSEMEFKVGRFLASNQNSEPIPNSFDAPTINIVVGKTAYTMTFDYNDSVTEAKTVEVEDGKAVEKPANPTRDGHEFLGWFLGNEEFDFETAITGDITLTAHWRAVEIATTSYIVTFNYNDEVTEAETVEVEDGNAVAKPANPTREGYTFLGWFLGDEEFNFATAISGNITLTAKWEIEAEEVIWEKEIKPVDTDAILDALSAAAQAIEEGPADKGIITLTGPAEILLNVNLVIPEGVTLIVSEGVQLVASPGKNLIVEEGGALVIEDGATVTVHSSIIAPAAFAFTPYFDDSVVGLFVKDTLTVKTGGVLNINAGAVALVYPRAVINGEEGTINISGRIVHQDGRSITPTGSALQTYAGEAYNEGEGPEPQSATINGKTLIITFDDTLTDSTADKDVFTLTGVSGNPAISDVVVSGTTITLTLASAAKSTDTVTVDYQPVVGKILTGETKGEAAAFMGYEVTNETQAVTIDFTEKTGGIDKILEIVVTDNENVTSGEDYLAIQITNGAGAGANVSIVLCPVDDLTTTISFKETVTKVEVWLFDAMPDFTQGQPGQSGLDAEILSYAIYDRTSH